MRLNLIIILIFSALISGASNPAEIDDVRDSFYHGWTGECGASDLYNQLREFDLTNPIILAYKGAAQMTQANCVGNPWKKYQYFKSGKKELELSLEKDPENFEIRYLRFAVQSNLPSILNYNNIEEDKLFLIESLILHTQNAILDEFKHFVFYQMIQSEELTQEEKIKLNLLLSRN